LTTAQEVKDKNPKLDIALKIGAFVLKEEW